MTRDTGTDPCEPAAVTAPAPVRQDPLLAVVRAAVGTSMRLIQEADAAAERATGSAARLRAALRVPLARRPVDDL